MTDMLWCFRRPLQAPVAVALLLALACPAPAQPPDQLIDKLLELAREKKIAEPQAGEDELRLLLIKRFNIGLEELKQRCEDFKKNLASIATVFEAGRHMLDAELEMQTTPEGRVKVLERTLELVRWQEARIEQSLKAKVGLRADLLKVQYFRVGLEIDLVKSRRAINTSRAK